MYKRLTILSVIIIAALCGLTLLGYHAIEKWAQGLKWARHGEFVEVAEQIRQDVNRKLREFIQAEQNRPYTHYKYYYAIENVIDAQQQALVQRSPLAGRMDNKLAYGYFQIEPDGRIITPNDDIVQREGATEYNKSLSDKAKLNTANIEAHLLPVLKDVSSPSVRFNEDKKVTSLFLRGMKTEVAKDAGPVQRQSKEQKRRKAAELAGKKSDKYYPIDSLQELDAETQIIKQQRDVIARNVYANVPMAEKPTELSSQREALASESESRMTQRPQETVKQELRYGGGYGGYAGDRARRSQAQPSYDHAASSSGPAPTQIEASQIQQAPPSRTEEQDETVQVKVGRFWTLAVEAEDTEPSVFPGQVFVVRHIQIEDTGFWQGFQLNEKRLIEEVKESAARFMREGMSFELLQKEGQFTENNDIVHKAVLDFVGLGYLVLNLKEKDAARIAKQIAQLRNWYFSIIAIVLLAAGLGLSSLWRNVHAQVRLAQKKDDFISAVSHELRTPLTSIRMYSEMLEKDWVKSKDKVTEYYRSMRQESERLSRLIENVLDFSRIQKGRKKYAFSLGDFNECIAGVVEMMRPYAANSGFSIKTDLGQLEQTAFDTDAVKQIVVNLLDNAIKYARNAEDKTVIVRTKCDHHFAIIEVEDHGPGVPHRQRKKIFEEFYRLGSEATRETTGTGLGLALVKKFAQAHNGFVEILTAKPAGTIFRVALATQR